MPFMRLAVIAIILLFTTAPGVATAARNTAVCRRMTRQIAHFEDVGRMAEERGDELWEAETRRHLGRLETRRASLCPEYAAQLRSRTRAARIARQTKEFIKAAAKTAVRYFTFGAF